MSGDTHHITSGACVTCKQNGVEVGQYRKQYLFNSFALSDMEAVIKVF